MSTLLVTSTEDGTGKTAITIALAKQLQDNGESVGYMKPKGTRLESAVGKTRDEDPMLAREMLDLDAQMHTFEPVVYSPTFVHEAIRGREDADELQDRIEESYANLSAESDHMVIEGGGKLSTGGIVGLTDSDVAELVDAKVVLVYEYEQPEDVDEILAASEQIGDRLAGVLFNGVSESDHDELAEDVIPFLNARGVENLGVVPHDESLAGVTAEELADQLGAEQLTPEVSGDVRIERFSVGAMGSEAALKKLRRLRNSAVITGGDRSEIQTAALQASGVSCLILTGGFRPSNAVLGEAADQEVPVLLVQTDTRATIDRTESRLSSGRTQQIETVERMQELLAESVELTSLFDLT
ncbi:phosphotransacetylase family protein [Halovenus rubra]|uniref:Phosphotransacetylase family protein n=2 Tax=Halovenus rubra TaxID=869890 RepID=A0ABD5X4E3_9EURY|nr:phosphotransacetylase family protein [Halovenus rubra]